MRTIRPITTKEANQIKSTAAQLVSQFQVAGVEEGKIDALIEVLADALPDGTSDDALLADLLGIRQRSRQLGHNLKEKDVPPSLVEAALADLTRGRL
jgi:hypothetical protein